VQHLASPAVARPSCQTLGRVKCAANKAEVQCRRGRLGPSVRRRPAKPFVLCKQAPPSAWAVRPSGGQRTIGAVRKKNSEFVRLNKVFVSVAQPSRVRSQIHERRAHQLHQAQQSKGPRRISIAALCFIVGPAEYRSAWAAGPVRRQLSLAPRGVLPCGCRTNAALVRHAA
jgi:hypothetical protein